MSLCRLYDSFTDAAMLERHHVATRVNTVEDWKWSNIKHQLQCQTSSLAAPSAAGCDITPYFFLANNNYYSNY